MKYRIAFSVIGAAALFLSVPVYASQAQNLIQANGCSACHTAKQKIVGPAWDWVAYRYQGKKGAVDAVANFIINGGVGYWKPWTGGVPMPSHPNLTKAQAKVIAKWVLSHTPSKPPKS